MKTLQNLSLYSLTAFVFALFCSYPFWFPCLCSCVKHFAFVSLPNLMSLFFCPKCLFIVGNAIIAFLVGESKLACLRSSPATEIREEASTHTGDKEERLKMDFAEESANKIEDKYMVESVIGEVKPRDNDGNGQENEEEECGLPSTEELNKRVEDFIAKVNRQRWLEASLDDCGRG
ncbi:uncharacterized protein LOC130780577 [Actinidia eriantha]|uniref:uncharacterized protein LOC130780577 n=1 Tax=Actinidia eriantha TaxID=165200 RepID=UPI00258A62BE|nr:uncharacterized protein LOC130780577 [Actinidia eriantha]